MRWIYTLKNLNFGSFSQAWNQWEHWNDKGRFFKQTCSAFLWILHSPQLTGLNFFQPCCVHSSASSSSKNLLGSGFWTCNFTWTLHAPNIPRCSVYFICRLTWTWIHAPTDTHSVASTSCASSHEPEYMPHPTPPPIPPQQDTTVQIHSKEKEAKDILTYIDHIKRI